MSKVLEAEGGGAGVWEASACPSGTEPVLLPGFERETARAAVAAEAWAPSRPAWVHVRVQVTVQTLVAVCPQILPCPRHPTWPVVVERVPFSMCSCAAQSRTATPCMPE